MKLNMIQNITYILNEKFENRIISIHVGELGIKNAFLNIYHH